MTVTPRRTVTGPDGFLAFKSREEGPVGQSPALPHRIVNVTMEVDEFLADLMVV
jgi:hypothetical protein